MNLIQAQDEFICGVLAATPYAKGDRGTLLNRKVLVLRALRGRFYKRLSKMGFSESEARPALYDASEMAELEYYSEFE